MQYLQHRDTALETMSVIKDRKIVPTVEPFVALGLLNLMPFDALLMLCKNLIKFDAQLPKNDALNFILV